MHGGDVAIAYGVDLADGRRVFVKTHRAPPPGFFTTEAAGLAWLADADAVAVPAVLAVSDDAGAPRAVVDRAAATPRRDDADLGAPPSRPAPGRRAGFGREDRRTTGSRALPNEPTATWSEFYASCRLLPLARLARDAGALRTAAIDDLELLAGRLAPSAARRAAGTAARRPVGRQSARRRRRAELADRPRRARRPPRVRPGDDAPVRRVRAGLLRRLRRGATRWPTAGATASPCTRSPRSWCTPSSSAAATSAPPARRRRAIGECCLNLAMSVPTSIEFFFDPACPWTWMTLRWLVYAAAQTGTHIQWRNLSLAVVNAEREIPERYRVALAAALGAHRIVAALLADGRNDLVGDLYTEFGRRFHHDAVDPTAQLGADVAIAVGAEKVGGRRGRRVMGRGRRVVDGGGQQLAGGSDVGSPALAFGDRGEGSSARSCRHRPRGDAVALLEHVAATPAWRTSTR